MAITDSFKEAVATGDVKDLRIMMKNSLLVDPTFNEFNEMNSLARNVDGLYEAHDGRDMSSDMSAWNDDYMNKLMVQVVDNFSHERIDHLKKVVRYLHPAAIPQRQTPTDRAAQPRRTTSNRGVKIAGGAVGGGVVGGAIAGIVGGSVFFGVVTGAVIAGAVVAIATNEE